MPKWLLLLIVLAVGGYYIQDQGGCAKASKKMNNLFEQNEAKSKEINEQLKNKVMNKQ